MNPAQTNFWRKEILLLTDESRYVFETRKATTAIYFRQRACSGCPEAVQLSLLIACAGVPWRGLLGGMYSLFGKTCILQITPVA